MTATDTSPVSVASYFVNMYFSECLHFHCRQAYMEGKDSVRRGCS